MNVLFKIKFFEKGCSQVFFKFTSLKSQYTELELIQLFSNLIEILIDHFCMKTHAGVVKKLKKPSDNIYIHIYPNPGA